MKNIALFAMFASSAYCATAADLTLHKGESADLHTVYWVNGNCQSRLKKVEGIDLLEGPPGVTMSIRPEEVVAKKQGCPGMMTGGIVVLTTGDVDADWSGVVRYRVRYDTWDGAKETSHTRQIKLVTN